MGMTREEAIKQLRLLKGDITFGIASKVENKNQIEALSIAIASLETDEAYQLEYESTTKNDLVTLTFSKGTLKYSCKDYVVYKKDWLRSHYGAEIDIMFGDSQYNEPTTKNDLGVNVHDNNVGNIDCISRADAIGSIAVECSAEKLDIDYAKFLMLRRAIKALPTVTPISKDCTDCIAEDKTFMKMDRIKQLLNSDKLDDSEVLEKIIEVVEE